MGSPYRRMGPQDYRSAEPVDDGSHVAWVQNVNISSAAIGNTDDEPWNGTDDNATVISLLKAIALNTAS